MKPQLYINAVLCIESKENAYRKINSDLKRLQGDFPTHVQFFDNAALGKVVDAIDDALQEMTGFSDLASYYLWEAPQKALIKSTDGHTYTWTCGEEFEQAIYQMIKDKNRG